MMQRSILIARHSMLLRGILRVVIPRYTIINKIVANFWNRIYILFYIPFQRKVVIKLSLVLAIKFCIFFLRKIAMKDVSECTQAREKFLANFPLRMS